METISELLWPVALFVLVAAAVGLGYRELNRWNTAEIERRSRGQELDLEERRLTLLERKNTANLASQTLDEHAASELASLRRKAAEDDAAARVAADPSLDAARVEAERTVIAAGAEGRAAAARERGMALPAVSDLPEILQAYRHWVDTCEDWDSVGSSDLTLGVFLGNLRFTADGRLTT